MFAHVCITLFMFVTKFRKFDDDNETFIICSRLPTIRIRQSCPIRFWNRQLKQTVTRTSLRPSLRCVVTNFLILSTAATQFAGSFVPSKQLAHPSAMLACLGFRNQATDYINRDSNKETTLCCFSSPSVD